MRLRTIISIVCYCALSCVTCAPFTTQAQSPGTQPASAAGQDATNDLVVAVGKSVLVDSAKTVERIAVGSSDIAEATAVSRTEIMINGKAPGDTTLIVWQVGGGRQFFNVRIRASTAVAGDRLDALRRELKAEFPGQNLRVTADGGNIFLRGTVKDLGSSDRAVQIASTAGKVVNLLYVTVPPAEPQILLKVRFASLDRSSTKQLGLNIFSTGATNTIGSVTTQQFSPPSVTGNGTAASPTTFTLSSLLNIFLFRPDLNLGATIQALQSNGTLQILAEPNLLTANGKQGSFLAGGEYPYPVVQGSGTGNSAAITVQFKEFGVRLNFIPTITPRGTIRLQVAPEVSSLDFADGLSLSGFTIPALSTRKVKTEVELSEGQSFAIAGLLDNRETKILSKIPFIGDIPVLGKFFQSVSKIRNNTELIVIVTPVIVPPIPVGAPLPQLKYPDEFLAPLSGGPTATQGAEAVAKPHAVPPSTMPVEELYQSLRPEQPLVINSTTPGVLYGSPTGGVAATTGTTAPAAPQ